MFVEELSLLSPSGQSGSFFFSFLFFFFFGGGGGGGGGRFSTFASYTG